MKNELNTCFQQKFATGSYGVGIGLKEKIEKKLLFFTQAAQTAIDQFLVSMNFRG
jgi:hypothetical protein